MPTHLTNRRRHPFLTSSMLILVLIHTLVLQVQTRIPSTVASRLLLAESPPHSQQIQSSIHSIFNADPLFRPSQTSDNKLDVICIPCNDNYTLSMSRQTMPLASSIGMDDCSASEKLLKRIPYVPEESFAFIWSRRSLLSLSDKRLQDINQEWHADYMMYVCLDEDAGVARNKYLESVSGVYVYGDAFLFKMKRGGLAKLERAEYVNMNDDLGDVGGLLVVQITYYGSSWILSCRITSSCTSSQNSPQSFTLTHLLDNRT